MDNDGHTTNALLPTDFFHTQLIQIMDNRVRWLSRMVPNRDVPDIQLNWISGQDLGIRLNRISNIRYIMISGIIRYPVEYQFQYYPVPLSLDSYISS